MELVTKPLRPLLRLFTRNAWRHEKDIELGRVFPTGVVSGSGVNVTPDSAMRASTVYSCVKILSEDVASTPCCFYEKISEKKRREADEHPLYEILKYQFNEDMTAKEGWELLMWYKLLRGWGHARIEFNGDGTVRALYPMNPDRLRVLQPTVASGGKPGFEYIEPDGKKWLLRWHEVFKLPGPFGLSVLSFAREVVGLQLAQQTYAGAFFANFAAPRGVVSFKDGLGEDDEAIKRWKKHFLETYSSPGNQWGVAVLENGATFQPISMTSQDAEFVDARQMSREDIGGTFRVPPYKYGDYTHATFSNVEELGVQYLNESLLSHFTGIAQCVRRDLLTVEERRRFYAEHNTKVFNRGTTVGRYDAYGKGRQNGFLSVNDIRAAENLDPIEGGDVYLVQPGYIPADMLEDFTLSQMAKNNQPQKPPADNNGPDGNREAPETTINLSVTNDIRRENIVKNMTIRRGEDGVIHASSEEQPKEAA